MTDLMELLQVLAFVVGFYFAITVIRWWFDE